MLEVLQISENGLKANQDWINSISNNVANMQTPGFKKTSLGFSELVKTDSGENGAASVVSGSGVKVSDKAIDFSQGDLKMTNRALDLAIEGAGFFEVEMNNGEVGYTRLGRLSVNADGNLVTQNGERLSGDIVIPIEAQSVTVNADGAVLANLGDGEQLELGSIQIFNFANPESLRPIGGETYLASDTSGQPEVVADNSGHKILQGFLEMSNVNLIDEMGDLLMAQRSYQLNARLIQTADQILETINNLRR